MFNLNHYTMKRSTVLIVLLHLIYWATPLIRLYTFRHSGSNNFYFNYCYSTLWGLVFFYIIYCFIFPNFIQKRRPLTDRINFILFFIIMTIALGLPILTAYFNTFPKGKYYIDVSAAAQYIA